MIKLEMTQDLASLFATKIAEAVGKVVEERNGGKASSIAVIEHHIKEGKVISETKIL